MISQLYAVRDRKTGAYSYPQPSPLQPEDYFESLRRATLAGKIERAQAVDAEIYYVGSYDDTTATFSPKEREYLGCLGDFLGPDDGKTN